MRQEGVKYMTAITPPERLNYSTIIMQGIQNKYFQKHIIY